MKQRPALMTSTFLTVFVWVIISGVVARVTAAETASEPQTVAVGVTEIALDAPLEGVALTEANVDPAVQAIIAEREAAYRALIAQANAQLQQAYDEQQALTAQLNQLQWEATQYAISPEMAIANALGATLGSAPELVDFEGTIAYEVAFEQGTAYVDAYSGEVLQGAVYVGAYSNEMGHTSNWSHPPQNGP